MVLPRQPTLHCPALPHCLLGEVPHSCTRDSPHRAGALGLVCCSLGTPAPAVVQVSTFPTCPLRWPHERHWPLGSGHGAGASASWGNSCYSGMGEELPILKLLPCMSPCELGDGQENGRAGQSQLPGQCQEAGGSTELSAEWLSILGARAWILLLFPHPAPILRDVHWWQPWPRMSVAHYVSQPLLLLSWSLCQRRPYVACPGDVCVAAASLDTSNALPSVACDGSACQEGAAVGGAVPGHWCLKHSPCPSPHPSCPADSCPRSKLA